MIVFVKEITGHTLTIDVNPSDQILKIKEAVYDKIGLYPNRQKLIFAGKLLCDDLSLSDYNLAKESTIHMILRFPGG